MAASHLRVGTFSYAAAAGDLDQLRALADHAIARHHPDAAGEADPYLGLFRRVVDAQAELVARWMLVGFVHGVMNTDNMTISGETIDYGPCAFMDAFDPRTVFSSIDTGGRYAYGNQPAVAQWDLARLAEALLPLMDGEPDAAIDAATAVLDGFVATYRGPLAAGMAAKLGPSRPSTSSWSPTCSPCCRPSASTGRRSSGALAAGTARDLVLDRDAMDAWTARWTALGPDRAAMDRVNPAYIPRNHRVEEALAAATAGDLDPFLRLLDVVRRPFDERPGLESYAQPGTGPIVTYCGT